MDNENAMQWPYSPEQWSIKCRQIMNECSEKHSNRRDETEFERLHVRHISIQKVNKSQHRNYRFYDARMMLPIEVIIIRNVEKKIWRPHKYSCRKRFFPFLNKIFNNEYPNNIHTKTTTRTKTKYKRCLLILIIKTSFFRYAIILDS